MTYIEITSEAASNLSAQLWKYYSIDGDCTTTITLYRDGVYRVYFNTDHGVNDCYVKMKIYDHCIEDLILVGSDGPIEPTTTLEEQLQR